MHAGASTSPRSTSSRRRRSAIARRATAGGVLAPIAAGFLLAACAQEAGGDAGPTDLDPATAEVEYRYNDSSVAPEYHRSYTITVRDGEARMVVDSYGDVLHDVTEEVDGETWTELLDEVGAVRVRDPEPSSECAGGTSREVLVTDAEHPASDPAVLGHAEVCGGTGADDASIIDAAIEPVLALFDTEELLATE